MKRAGVSTSLVFLIFILFVSLIPSSYILTKHTERDTNTGTMQNPRLDYPPDIIEALINSHYSNAMVTPYLTYWMSSDALWMVETVVYINGTAYLAEVYPQNRSVALREASGDKVREYLDFFRENGGRVYENASQVSNGSTNITLSGIVPAVVHKK
jgi:hypothetical protein